MVMLQNRMRRQSVGTVLPQLECGIRSEDCGMRFFAMLRMTGFLSCKKSFLYIIGRNSGGLISVGEEDGDFPHVSVTDDFEGDFITLLFFIQFFTEG